MRVSSYLIGSKIPDQPFYILLHGYTGAVDKVPTSIGGALVENRGGEINGMRGKVPELTDSRIDFLRSRGYLTSLSHAEERQKVVEIAALLHERDLMRSPTGFMLIPTYMCNLRCSYCFQTHDMHAGRGKFSEVMNRERVDQAYAVMDRFDRGGAVAEALGLTPQGSSQAQIKSDSVALFGGEPFSPETLEIVSYSLEQAQRRGKHMTATTNGVDLKRFEHLLGPGKITQLQITIDGSPEIHDQRRIGPGFRSTFDTIVDSIQLALDRGVAVNTRLNIDTQNQRDLPWLLDFFKQKGWNESTGFRAYAAAVEPERQRIETMERDELVELTVLNNQEAVAGGFRITSYERIAEETLDACLDNNGYPFRKAVNCSAESGLLMFDPFGDVYACWEEIGQEEFRIATYDWEGLHFDHDTAKSWLTRFPGAIEECSNCPYALIHTSGCASHARKWSGTMFASACEAFQDFFPPSFANAYSSLEIQMFEKRPAAPTACPQPTAPQGPTQGV